MDPYNLAICFGPTLVPIPTDRDQVQYQNLVNELIKNFIIFHEDIFPLDGLGVVYEKYISSEPDDVQEYGNEDSVLTEDDLESEVTEDGKILNLLVFFPGFSQTSCFSSVVQKHPVVFQECSKTPCCFLGVFKNTLLFVFQGC